MTIPFTPDALLERLTSLGAAARYWVAYSGGLDSSVLLAALAALRERLPGTPGAHRLLAVHVDHGLQADSGAWAEHCSTRCAALAIPLRVERPTTPPAPGESLEAWARAVRRTIFRRLLAPGDFLLTAQHRDDQAETLLLALLRGSGPHGLAAMPFSAPLGRGTLARPLLDFSRQALVDYARCQGLDWIEDPSNDHTAFDRNYLRWRVLPLLRERWPAVTTTLARSARHCAEAAELVDRYAAQALAESRGVQGAGLGLALPALARLDRPLRKAVVRRWLVERGFSPPDARRLDRLLDELPAARSDANPGVAWRGGEVRRYRGEILAFHPLPPLPTGAPIDWSITAERGILELPPGFGRLEWMCRPLEPGGASPQTRIRLQVRFGQSGHVCRREANRPRRALKQLFQEAGIPVWLRRHVPQVFQGERLIAMVGIGACHDCTDQGALSLTLSWSGFAWESDWPGLKRVLTVSIRANVGGEGS